MKDFSIHQTQDLTPTEHRGIKMNKIFAVIISSFSLSLYAQSYNPNARYYGNQQQPQQQNQQQQQGQMANPSGGGNLVNDMNQSADKVDKMGQATEMLGNTAVGVGTSMLASCYFSGGTTAASGSAYYQGIAGGDSPSGAGKSTANPAYNEAQGEDCYGVSALVVAAGVGLTLNGKDAKKKAGDIRQQACEVSAQGCDYGSNSGVNAGNRNGAPQSNVDEDVAEIMSDIPKNLGIRYDPDTKSFTTPDGSSVPLSAARDGSALNAAMSMMSGPGAEKVKKIKEKLDRINKESKVISMGFASGGGGGGSRGGGIVFEEDDSLDKLLAQMRNKNRRKQRTPSATAAGKVSTYNGGPIGHRMDNLFEMIHRAYDKYTEMGYFYPPGTRLGPDGLPVRQNK